MLYIDTADVNEIKKYVGLNVVHGVTTNQGILLKNGKSDVKGLIREICDVTPMSHPVNVELTRSAGSDAGLVAEAEEYWSLSGRLVIKVPFWTDGRGLRIVKMLHEKGIPTNLTCCMSAEQVLLACSANSEYVSLFFNRIVDYSTYDSACLTLKKSSQIIEDYGFATELIAGSIRKPGDVVAALLNGVDIVTVPPKIMEQLLLHPKTDDAIREFDEAWAKLTSK